MDFLYYIIIIMYMSGMIVFFVSFNHFLFVLLSLEFMMLAVFLSLFSTLSMTYMNMFFSMIYLTMVVCEGVLGLSIMVSVIRTGGNDNLMSFTSLW